MVCGDLENGFVEAQEMVLWEPKNGFVGPKCWFCGDLDLVLRDLNFVFVGT